MECVNTSILAHVLERCDSPFFPKNKSKARTAFEFESKFKTKPLTPCECWRQNSGVLTKSPPPPFTGVGNSVAEDHDANAKAAAGRSEGSTSYGQVQLSW